MRYQDATAYLYGLKAKTHTYGIDRIRAFVAALGHPQKQFPSVHVAGTNGKGSVCALLDAVCRTAGLRTGLYTSPHLIHLGERIRVGGRRLGSREIVQLLVPLREVAEKIGQEHPDLHPSFFEWMTAMAFLHFAREGVDLAVVETGLGGRLDATNILAPQLTVITSIGFDHMEWLGDTLEKIASEKAGIIKPHTPVVIGLLPPEAEAVIREKARREQAPVVSVRETWGDDPTRYPSCALPGPWSTLNAATAALALEQLRPLFPALDIAAQRRGFRRVRWPGRWQRLRLADGRILIIDGTHNPAAAPFLDTALSQLFQQTGQRPHIITGIVGEDRAEALLPLLARHAAALTLVRPDQPRATDPQRLEALLRKQVASPPPIHHATLDSLFPCPRHCTIGEAGQPLVLTGSLYLAGEALDRLLHRRRQGESHLQD